MTAEFPRHIVEASVIDEVKAECIQIFNRTGSKINAVRYIRERLLCGVKEAIDLFDAEYDPIQVAERVAKKRLEDAAPQLLEALRMALVELAPHKSFVDMPKREGDTQYVRDQIAAAIAAADGAQS